jgi:capsular exopolysaccharide synthesis family protein
MQHSAQAVVNTWQLHETRQDAALVRVDIARVHKDRIDYAQARQVTLDMAVLKENRILTGAEPGQFAESYHLLRTQILRRFQDNNWKLLAVTSPCKGEGRTLTAINLAVSIAREIAWSVLLVDANLRHPVMLEHFGLPVRNGLSDYLTGEMPVEDLLIQPDRFEDLVILPGGQPLDNSAEMLNSPGMRQLVADIRSSDDNRMVIFDLPPVLSTSEALAFSTQVDAVLLVVEDGVTNRQDIARAATMLDSTTIVGTVLNKAGPRIP